MNEAPDYLSVEFSTTNGSCIRIMLGKIVAIAPDDWTQDKTKCTRIFVVGDGSPFIVKETYIEVINKIYA